MITLKNIFVKKFGHVILKDISLHITPGEVFSIIGKNGAGKSTLGKILVGALKPSSGKIIKTKNIRISYVPQLFERSVILPIKVKDFLFLGLKDTIEGKVSYYVTKLIEKLELVAKFHSNLNDLSGGEMQKVLLIRALIRFPNLLILDEAFSFLDLSSILKIHNIIFEEQKACGFSMVFISHDIDFVIKHTNYIICLEQGNIHCQGNFHNIKETDYIKDVMGRYIHKEHT